jgi:diphosphomevalonate decarboxylase
MKQTVLTSILYQKRLAYLPPLIKKTKKAILERDFQTLAEIIMRESDNLHAVMLDTWPPIFYLNDISKEIIYKILELNEKEKRYIAAYTFDAGPNAHIFTLKKYKKKVIQTLSQIKGIKKIFVARVGSGPRILEDEKDFLIDPKNGKIRKCFFDARKNKILIKR